jgi:hypothetical protein
MKYADGWCKQIELQTSGCNKHIMYSLSRMKAISVFKRELKDRRFIECKY